MPRVLLTASIAAALAAGAVGGTEEAHRLDLAYSDRLLEMEDTAAAHVELARWCRDAGLEGKARLHWQEALVRDPDQRAARAALGYVRRGLEWVKAEEAGPGGGAPTTGGPAPAADTHGATGLPSGATVRTSHGQRARAVAQTVRHIFTEYLGSADRETWREGVRRLLMIRDPSAAGPVYRILSAGDEETRRVMCEVLAQLPTPEAARLLVRTLLTDPSRAVYETAIDAIGMRSDDYALGPLLNALNGSEAALKRSAHALGELREARAVPPLIGRLTTREPRVKDVDVPQESGGYFFSGTVVPYVADVEPVVAPGVVAWKPIIAGIPTGAMVSAGNTVVTVRKRVMVEVRQREVRLALEKITGRDFKYDQAAWRRWLREHEARTKATE